VTIALRSPTEEQIASIMRLRRTRSETFGTELFGDFAWDILLQLFAAKLGRRKTKLADLAIVAPESTIARWAAVLEERGYILCQVDRFNHSDMWVELSSSGAVKMSRLFADRPDWDPLS
jgi:hypothetical protein